MKSKLLSKFLWCLLLVSLTDGARFSVNGPVLTVTLKDPAVYSSDASSKWLNLANLRPNILWSIQSQSKPLPNWLPNLQSLRGTVGYHYEDLKRLPSYVEGDFRFSTRNIDLQVQPSYEFKPKRSVLFVQASRGAAYVMAKFGNALEVIRGCYQLDLPYAAVGGVRVTPTYNLKSGEDSCLFEATTGNQRTKAVLNLEYQNPTLSIIHSLGERHVIAPEISLYNAKITYQWNIDLDSGSIRTKVDPTSAVHVSWTDKSMTGKWVTDFRLPLVGTTISALAADVRVRRQFSF